MQNCVLFVIDNAKTANELFKSTIPNLLSNNIDVHVVAMRHEGEDNACKSTTLRVQYPQAKAHPEMVGEDAGLALMVDVLKNLRPQRQSIAVVIQQDMHDHDNGSDTPSSIEFVHMARQLANIVMLFHETVNSSGDDDAAMAAWKEKFLAAYPGEAVPYRGSIASGDIESTVIKLFRS